MHKPSNLKGQLFVLALCAMFSGCDDSTSAIKYGDVCEASGGTLKDGKCFCGSDPSPCNPGVVCSTEEQTKCAEGKIQSLNPPVIPCQVLGEVLCIDGSYQKCDGGKWSKIRTCSTVDNKKVACANSNACGECFEDEWICRQDNGMYVQQQCKQGKWVTVKECGNFGCGVDNACATQKCTIEGGKSCQNDINKQGTLLECKGDATEITKCGAKSGSDSAAYSCKPDNTCGECLNGDKKCENGILSTCKDGTWNTSPCPGGAACKDETACSECKNAAMKCDNGQMYKCELGKWSEPQSCANGASCKSETECGECRTDTNVCIGGKLYKCTNGILESPEPCEKDDAPVSCKNDASCGECKTGAERCEGSQKSTCISGLWTDPEACPNQSSCKNETACGECRSDTNVCSGGKLYKCKNGILETPEPCEKDGAPVSCKNDASCGECVNDQIKCENNANGVGVFKECKNGIWEEGKLCGNNVSCNDESTCGECKDKDIKCDNNNGIGQESTCTNGVWVKAETRCADSVSCNPEKNRCGDCRNGTANTCKNQGDKQIGEFSTCENGQWKATQCEVNAMTSMRNSCCDNNQCSKGECGDCNISKEFYCKGNDLYQCKAGYGVVYETCGKNGCNTETGKCNL